MSFRAVLAAARVALVFASAVKEQHLDAHAVLLGEYPGLE